mmetsp:Transcript_20841/g.62304  ORF Transcript_20841/g.62304 Transcript_20841/m.62304 type:complete len:237 (+) Transcript_20841:255-965(+)
MSQGLQPSYQQPPIPMYPRPQAGAIRLVLCCLSQIAAKLVVRSHWLLSRRQPHFSTTVPAARPRPDAARKPRPCQSAKVPGRHAKTSPKLPCARTVASTNDLASHLVMVRPPSAALRCPSAFSRGMCRCGHPAAKRVLVERLDERAQTLNTVQTLSTRRRPRRCLCPCCVHVTWRCDQERPRPSFAPPSSLRTGATAAPPPPSPLSASRSSASSASSSSISSRLSMSDTIDMVTGS